MYSVDKESNHDLSSVREVDKLVARLLSNLFQTDGGPISMLVRSLMSVRPAMQIHQLEGIFSVPDKDEVSMEVIDFDGLDVFDLSRQRVKLSPSERLTRGQLSSLGFLLTDPESLLSFVSLQSKINNSIKTVTDSPIIPEDIKREFRKHFLNSPELFSRELTGAVKLARLLMNIGVEWEDTEIPQVKRFNGRDDTLTLITVEGYDMVFWDTGNGLVDCSNIERLSRKLSQITGREIVKAHFSSTREGD